MWSYRFQEELSTELVLRLQGVTVTPSFQGKCLVVVSAAHQGHPAFGRSDSAAVTRKLSWHDCDRGLETYVLSCPIGVVTHSVSLSLKSHQTGFCC
jgi:hypothetical protein